ncbi:invasion associated locus B family protein [Ochrobactrum sp. Marseille-Q0166]|uniref:invasion associated locus B family protein n=1 Tax=Ochrobactrum sp. Marseille-Q0166 TaxID=2761105 RepID=UPI001FFF8D74|nr:invasion associated locus B family protein [Ochrobactrum sp. Marseille-Q0166]
MPSAEEDSQTRFVVKPSDVEVPKDVDLGHYRRILRPFLNWTLICDENLQRQQRVCNVSQTIVKTDGTIVFSWSLAATQDGQPFFILRVPPVLGTGDAIHLDLGDGGSVVSVPITACDQKICIGYQRVGPRLRLAITKGLVVHVSYSAVTSSTRVSFIAPFEGLATALAAI